jgi:DsbC/DsbD-like thiol-disulfide interchange protein
MTEEFHHIVLRRIPFALFLSTTLCAIGFAQVPDETVKWVASLASETPAGEGGNATLELSAGIREGWHVYALTQPQGGPTALRLALDENGVARVAGAPSASVPERRQDPSFDLETQFYTRSFTVRLPVQVTYSAAGGRSIPVSVRFQACSERVCLPPQTIHLLVPIDAPSK